MGTVKYTGPVASFHCPTNAEIRSLKVHFSPKQLGEGDSSPENVREIVGWDGVSTYKCGKNIGKVKGYSASSLQSNNSTRKLTNNYGTTLNSVDYNLPDTSLIITQNQAPETATKNSYKNGYISVVLDNLIFGETYKVSFKITNIVSNPLDATLASLRGMSPAGNAVTPQIINNNIVCFTLPFREGRNSEYKAFELRICGMSFTMSEFMVTTVDVEDRIFEPYQGSTTNYEFGVLGKNKFDYSTANIVDKKRRDDTGATVSDATGSYCQTLIPVRPNVTYTLSGYPVNNSSKRIYYIDAEENFIERTIAFGDSSYTFTTPNNCYYIQIQNREVGENASWETIQLELGSTATTYEPYNPNKTVYGGWVDLISGEVVSTYLYCKIKDLPGEWNYRSGNNRFQITLTDNYANAASSGGIWTHFATSEVYKTSTSNGYGNKQIATYIDKHIYIRDDDFEGDVEAFLNGIGDTYVTYELAESTTYSLSSTEMQTFLGQNNIWSNADYVEVEYDLHETQSILARKQFIMASQPHVVKPAAAPLQNFITDVPAPLKEYKVHFSPMQEGSGDPSPENVRPIIGWDGVEVYRTGKNLFNKNDVTNNYWIRAGNLSEENPLGTIKENASGYALSSYIPVYPNTTYTINYNASSLATAAGMVFFSEQDANSAISGIALYYQTYINSSTTREYYTFTTPINCHYIRVSTPPESSDVQLELGSIATDYEPYNSTTIPITFPTEAGTVYGGYVDLIKGELVAEYGIVDLGTLPWHDATRYGEGLFMCYSSAFSSAAATNWIGFSNKYPCYDKIYQFLNNVTYGIARAYLGQNGSGIAIKDASITLDDLETMKTGLSGAILVYQLLNPIHYTITPTILKTLRGTNNIWSNAGDIKIKYWTH